MLTSEFPEVKKQPHLKPVFLQLDMMLIDLKVMLKYSGLNFAIAVLLCNLISGVSAEVYTPTDKSNSGARFRKLLEDFYPWEDGEKKDDKIEIMYEYLRNPLTHCLGVLGKKHPKNLAITVRRFGNPLTPDQVNEIEVSAVRPKWVPLAVIESNSGVDIYVEGLYWGVYHLLRKLVKDQRQMEEAEKRFSA